MKTALFSFAAAALALTACHSSRKTASGPAAPPAPGAYRATLPCADCPGVVTTIQLRPDGSYTRRSSYIDKNGDAFVVTGQTEWDATGRNLVLKAPGEGLAMRYAATDGALIQLDAKGQRITGPHSAHYVLHRVPDGDVRERYWRLTELTGTPLPAGGDSLRQPHLIFRDDRSRITGHGGCNGFSGTYELKSAHGLAVSRVIATRMACAEPERMAAENGFMAALQNADRYAVSGDTLTLLQQDRVLARLVAVATR